MDNSFGKMLQIASRNAVNCGKKVAAIHKANDFVKAKKENIKNNVDQESVKKYLDKIKEKEQKYEKERQKRLKEIQSKEKKEISQRALLEREKLFGNKNGAKNNNKEGIVHQKPSDKSKISNNTDKSTFLPSCSFDEMMKLAHKNLKEEETEQIKKKRKHSEINEQKKVNAPSFYTTLKGTTSASFDSLFSKPSSKKKSKLSVNSQASSIKKDNSLKSCSSSLPKQISSFPAKSFARPSVNPSDTFKNVKHLKPKNLQKTSDIYERVPRMGIAAQFPGKVPKVGTEISEKNTKIGITAQLSGKLPKKVNETPEKAPKMGIAAQLSGRPKINMSGQDSQKISNISKQNLERTPQISVEVAQNSEKASKIGIGMQLSSKCPNKTSEIPGPGISAQLVRNKSVKCGIAAQLVKNKRIMPDSPIVSDDDYEDEYGDDDFIDDSDLGLHDYKSFTNIVKDIHKTMRYDPSKLPYVNPYDDCSNMEAKYSAIEKEEKRSMRLGLAEDENARNDDLQKKKLKQMKY